MVAIMLAPQPVSAGVCDRVARVVCDACNLEIGQGAVLKTTCARVMGDGHPQHIPQIARVECRANSKYTKCRLLCRRKKRNLQTQKSAILAAQSKAANRYDTVADPLDSYKWQLNGDFKSKIDPLDQRHGASKSKRRRKSLLAEQTRNERERETTIVADETVGRHLHILVLLQKCNRRGPKSAASTWSSI